MSRLALPRTPPVPRTLPKQARSMTAYSMTARCEPLEEHVLRHCLTLSCELTSILDLVYNADLASVKSPSLCSKKRFFNCLCVGVLKAVREALFTAGGPFTSHQAGSSPRRSASSGNRATC